MSGDRRGEEEGGGGGGWGGMTKLVTGSLTETLETIINDCDCGVGGIVAS